ncbi:IS66 family transposase zinc-finger binding domain-containing protein, partial [Microvirga brassicacearum]
PSHFKVIRHIRPKMSCRDCETIVRDAPTDMPRYRRSSLDILGRPEGLWGAASGLAGIGE